MKEIRYTETNTETGESQEKIARVAESPEDLDAILSGKKFTVPPVCTARWTAEDWKKWIGMHNPEGEKRTYCESCGEETTGMKTIRTWACSSYCYADIMGICEPGY